MTNQIMLDLSIHDPEFYHHLKTISKIRAKINPKVSILSSQSNQ
jgi:hypothetical protein